MKFLPILAFVFALPLVSVGQNKFIHSDKRIEKYKDSIVAYLVRHDQFGPIDKKQKLSNYYGMVFIKKEVEIYRDSTVRILLVQFGSLADHGDRFWGLFDSTRCYMLYDFESPEFKKFEIQHDPRVVKVIKQYIELVKTEDSTPVRIVEEINQ